MLLLNFGWGILPETDFQFFSMYSISQCYALVGKLFLFLLLLLGIGVHSNAQPFTTKSGLFDQTKTNDLGLPTATGTETVTVFKATATSDHYANGVVMVGFKGYIYCQWQSSETNEDSPDTWVAYSRSQDGKAWSSPMRIAGPTSTYSCTSGGWWVNGDTLVAFINVWPSNLTPRGGLAYYSTSTDGLTWSAIKQVKMADGTFIKGIMEQDPHSLPNGRILNAAHFQPGLIAAPIYTDDKSGIRGWKRATYTNMTYTGDVTREIEPSWFLQKDGSAVMIFRDQTSTYRTLAAKSTDNGKSWSTAVLTDMPDSRAKQSAGNLPNGTAFMVHNPVPNKNRYPLAIVLSQDGVLFDKAYALRKGGTDLQAQRYTGTAKTLGYSYPKSMTYNGYLYAAYSTNKEDVEYTRIPLTSLGVANTNPTITITTPANNATYVAGSPIGFTVNAVDTDGFVAKVEFYAGTTLLGSVTSSPFSYSWTGATAGTYSISAVATDDKGAKTTSSVITIAVSAKPTDCAGIENGSATLDNCGRCTGGTTGKTECTSAGEAETDACSYDGTVDNNNAGFKGAGFINVPNAIGSEITFHVNAAKPGTTTLSFRYASGGTADRAATIILNGTALATNLSFPATGAFTTYKTIDIKLNLNEGTNFIQLKSITADGLANIDQIGYVSAGLSKGDCEEVVTNVVNGSEEQLIEIYPNPSQSSFNIKMPAPLDIEIIDIKGKTLKTFKSLSNLEFGDDLQPGVYFAKVKSKVYKFVKY